MLGGWIEKKKKLGGRWVPFIPKGGAKIHVNETAGTLAPLALDDSVTRGQNSPISDLNQ